MLEYSNEEASQADSHLSKSNDFQLDKQKFIESALKKHTDVSGKEVHSSRNSELFRSSQASRAEEDKQDHKLAGRELNLENELEKITPTLGEPIE
jgi:hypothetical protein